MGKQRIDLSDFTPWHEDSFLVSRARRLDSHFGIMPLSGAEQAAWAGVLSARRGGKALPTAVQTALVAFFADPPCVGRRCRCRLKDARRRILPTHV